MALESKGKQDEYFDELEIMAPAARDKYQSEMLSQAVNHAYKNALHTAYSHGSPP